MSHRRFNPLLQEWVLVSPARAARPWGGQIEPAAAAAATERYLPECALCPGNRRASGRRNPDYRGIHVFDNDYPALDRAPAEGERRRAGASPRAAGLLRRSAERGVCRVVCYSPRHDLGLGQLPAPALARLVEVWAEQSRELSARPGIRAVTIFENRGAMMGASISHPHGQIWANTCVPNLLGRERQGFAAYRQQHHRCLLCDYAGLERERGERVVAENAGFVAVVPYWAVWPFETLVISRAHACGLAGLAAARQRELADILRRLATQYDRLFDAPFPYSWGFHQGRGVHLHAHFLPPLLRSATIRKFQVGYEMLAMPQRDLTPEAAAGRLRERG